MNCFYIKIGIVIRWKISQFKGHLIPLRNFSPDNHISFTQGKIPDTRERYFTLALPT